jgi:hypothetical protein
MIDLYRLGSAARQVAEKFDVSPVGVRISDAARLCGDGQLKGDRSV